MGKHRTADEMIDLDFEKSSLQFSGKIVKKALSKEEYENFVRKYCAARHSFRGREGTGTGFANAPTPEELQAVYDFSEGKISFAQMRTIFKAKNTTIAQNKLGRVYAYILSTQKQIKKEAASNG